MEKDEMNIDIEHEKTEELEDLIKSINEEIGDLEDDVETLNFEEKEVLIRRTLENTSTNNYDFSELVKKRDYHGFKKDPSIPPTNGKLRLKKWVYAIIALIVIVLAFGLYKIISNANTAKKLAQEKEIVSEIKSHYNGTVKVDKDTVLYTKNNDKYEEIGKIYQNAVIELDKVDIDVNTKYFKMKDSDYYLAYDNLTKADKVESNSRYKKYIPFNINVITKDEFTLYDEDNKVITLKKEMEFPVIINDYDGKYYVEYNNQLVYLKKDDIGKTVEHKNTDKKNQSKITTLAYHRVYDTDEKCTDVYICIKKANFDKQMKYLSENNYLTLTMEEMYMYMKGYLQVEKAVTITFDDGYLYKSADEVLDKYQLNGTMFVISGDFKDYTPFKELKAITIQSHTHNMHRNYVCTGGNQGGAILCAGKTAIVNDLKKSIEALDVKPIALAFPFYDYNETAISALKEVGFKMSFIGRAGVLGRATPKVTDIYKIPRMTVWEESEMSFNEWKGYL